MSLLETFLKLLDCWRPAFCKEQSFQRAKEHAVAALTCFGRHTITSIAIFLSRGLKKPSADYKLYSLCKWNVEEIFNPLLSKCIELSDDKYIVVGVDDTKLHKTGKKIPGTSWQRDPMSPPFHVNFIWGLRFLQFSALIPLYRDGETPCRAIPVRFIDAPSLKRPGKKATPEQWQEYKELKKTHNLSHVFIKEVEALRKTLDQMKAIDKQLLIVGDGSFCNSTCMSLDIPNTHMIARCRRDAKLCKLCTGGKKVYDDEKFSPGEVLKNDNIPWQTKSFFYGGQWRKMRYKEVNHVVWQSGTKRKLLRLIVLEPLPYVRGGKTNYRDPAYLLTTDLEGPITKLIQAYLDRIQIEYNFRDEKSIIGVGEAQVRNENSVEKQPALCVAAYSALLLASIIVYRDRHHNDFGDTPEWRPPPKRITTRALIGLLRKTLLEEPEKIVELNIPQPIIAAILSKAA